MSSEIVQPQDCCNPCPSPVVVNVPGPTGPTGPSGSSGTSGSNAYTTVSTGFTQPAVNGTVTVLVGNSNWMSVGQTIFIQNGGYYTVSAVNSSISIVLTNTGNAANVSPGTTVAASNTVSTSGPPGPTGATGLGTLNSISPTTTKGDLIVDNGSNAPAASDVRLGVGTNGQVLAANSGQATGVKWTTITPNSVANSGDIAIFSAASGTPTPIGDSKMFLDSTGALQNINGTFNARGTSAVDLQPVRSASTMVASGNFSTIAGGQNNTASGASSTVIGGSTNVASANGDSALGGFNNTAEGGNSIVCGGTLNIASGIESTVVGGSGNQATGSYAICVGGNLNTAAGTGAVAFGSGCNIQFNYASGIGLSAVPRATGFHTFANGSINTPGDTQGSDFLLFNFTTGATPTNLFLDGTSALPPIPTNTAWAYDGMLIRRLSTGATRAWYFAGVIKNNSGTVTVVGSPPSNIDLGHDDTNNTFTIGTDGSGHFQIQVTGTAATTINWVARVRTVEVTL